LREEEGGREERTHFELVGFVIEFGDGTYLGSIAEREVKSVESGQRETRRRKCLPLN